jgi:uncharacterized protein (TIGR03437 family)
MLKRLLPTILAAALCLSGQQLTSNARRQIAALLAEKASRNPAQAKLDSHLVHAAAILRGQPVHRDFPAPPGELEAVRMDGRNRVEVDIGADVTEGLLARIGELGGTVIHAFPEYRSVRARLPLLAVERLAGRSEVRQIRAADEGHSNLGPDTSGDIAHQANRVRADLGLDGTGVKVGVLSDGVDSLAAERAAGRLPATVTVLPGKAGVGDEGTAMLEIVYSLAPGASLYYATATGGQAAMANNIQALADAGCKIIIDDWTYFGEGVFQDDIVARKVNELAAAGIFYFSDAQNSGSVLKGNSGTWEGDFLDAGPAPPPLTGAAHNFGTASLVLPYDSLATATPLGATGGFKGDYELKWSDPLGGSSNDYDLFILDAGLNTVLGSSTRIQSGSQNPEEYINPSSNITAGSRIVIVKHPSAAVRALHLDTERGVLAIGTTGATFGHNAAAGAFTMAAVDVQRALGGAFTGGPTNYSYFYNSDGPRRMFYNSDGTAITPGNLVFATNGGAVLDKPDFTAADCVPTGVSGYTIFCGTSAAGPHAGAIAALALQAKPNLSGAQMRSVLAASALDIEGPGVDINSGAGIVMAPAAVTAALNTCTYALAPSGTVSLAAGAATQTVQVTADSGCSWNASSHSAWIGIASGAGGTGNGTVSYTVAANTTAAQRTGTVAIAGMTLTVTQAGASPSINAGGVVDNASYDSPIAPGSIAAVFGVSLTDGTSCLPPACNPTFGNGRLGTTMAGAQVTVNGTPVPIFYAVSGQLGIQIPFEAAGASATVSVSVGGLASAPATITLAPVAPGIFTATADGKGAAATTHVDGSAVTIQNPAHPGELVILYATGLGQVAPAVATGALPAGVSNTVAPVTLTIGGINVVPDFAGLAGCCVGLNQINARVPAGVGSGNAVSVVLNIGGKTSNTATIAVQ